MARCRYTTAQLQELDFADHALHDVFKRSIGIAKVCRRRLRKICPLHERAIAYNASILKEFEQNTFPSLRRVEKRCFPAGTRSAAMATVSCAIV